MRRQTKQPPLVEHRYLLTPSPRIRLSNIQEFRLFSLSKVSGMSLKADLVLTRLLPTKEDIRMGIPWTPIFTTILLAL